MSGRPPQPAKAVPPGKKSDRVARAILDGIAESGLRPGQTLATETELLARHGVSRPTLRESLRILEMLGAVVLRPGPGGGIVVGEPGIDRLAHGLSVFLRLRQVPFRAVLEARQAIEPALAGEAAMRASAADCEALDASIARMRAIRDDQEAFIEENRRFHDVIARASGNAVLATFWETISVIASGEDHGVRYSASNQRHVADAHRRIVAAIRARDPEAAARAMSAHVGELEQLVSHRARRRLREPVAMTPAPARGRA